MRLWDSCVGQGCYGIRGVWLQLRCICNGGSGSGELPQFGSLDVVGGGRVVLVVTVSAIGDAAINAEAGVCCKVDMVALFSVSANCYVLFLRQLRCVAEIVGSLGGIGGVGDLVGLDFCDLSLPLTDLAAVALEVVSVVLREQAVLSGGRLRHLRGICAAFARLRLVV